MRRWMLIAAIVPVLAFQAGCGGSTEPQFGVAEAKVIRQRTADFASTFNAKEVDKLIGFYASEVVFMPPNAPTLRGKDAVGNFFKDMFSHGATELKLDSTDVGGHGPLAYESGIYSLNRRPATRPYTRDRGKYMFIWRNTNAQWMMEYTIWSSDLPDKVDIAPVK